MKASFQFYKSKINLQNKYNVDCKRIRNKLILKFYFNYIISFRQPELDILNFRFTIL